MDKFTSDLKKTMKKLEQTAKKAVQEASKEEEIRLNIEEEKRVNGMVILDSLQEDVLKVLLEGYDGNDRFCTEFDAHDFPKNIHIGYNKALSKLEYSGYLSNFMCYGKGGQVSFTKEGINYFEDKEKFIEEQKRKELGKTTNGNVYNIGSINADGSNVVLGNVFDTTFNIDNSITNIENQIEKDGGEDKEILKELLAEAKEIIEEIQETRRIPKRKGFFDKLSNHLEKHGWFYGAIIGLVGQAGLALVGAA